MTVIRTGSSRAANPGPGKASPVPASTFRTFRAPIRRGVPRRCASRLFTPSMAFAVILPARLPLGPLTGLGLRRGRLRLMLRTARSLPLFQGSRRWASTPGVTPRRRQPATRLPGDYLDGTSTRWRRRACGHPRSDHRAHRPPIPSRAPSGHAVGSPSPDDGVEPNEHHRRVGPSQGAHLGAQPFPDPSQRRLARFDQQLARLSADGEEGRELARWRCLTEIPQ